MTYFYGTDKCTSRESGRTQTLDELCTGRADGLSEELGKSKEELLALGDAFGLGMGGMEATCGALTGAAIVLGLLNKSGQPSKMLMNGILHDFQKQAGATRCRDLKGVGTGKVLCACDDCVRLAVLRLDKALTVRD